MNQVTKVILAVAVSFAYVKFACADDIYTSQKPSSEMTKLEALTKLIESKNKAELYKCQQVKVSDKATIVKK